MVNLGDALHNRLLGYFSASLIFPHPCLANKPVTLISLCFSELSLNFIGQLLPSRMTERCPFFNQFYDVMSILFLFLASFYSVSFFFKFFNNNCFKLLDLYAAVIVCTVADKCNFLTFLDLILNVASRTIEYFLVLIAVI
jgi:hypothetical protein